MNHLTFIMIVREGQKIVDLKSKLLKQSPWIWNVAMNCVQWTTYNSRLSVQGKEIKKNFLSPSGDLGIGPVWDNLSPPDQTHFLVRLLKSSSNWTKLSMMDHQLFWGWYQMILDVFRCSQQFSNGFRLFSSCFPTMFSHCWNPLQAELNYLWWVLSCSQDDIRWF